MPTLHWIGKEAVVNHHQQVPFRLLHCREDLSVGDPGTGNLLVEGDNLLALKALLPYYAGKVKCIYIDPPYNTGNEGWVYNDNVNSPDISRWLTATVDRDDLSRHDKWLCMMYPRLALLRDFLTDDGAMFVSVDDNEESHLRLLMDEVFGARSFLAKLVWKCRQYIDSRAVTGISTDHEYILVYAKTAGNVRFRGRERDETKYSNPDNDPRGPWMSRSILGLATQEQRPNLHYDLADPATGITYPCPPNTGWRYSQDTIATKIAESRILFPPKKTGRPREKVFLAELKTEFTGLPSIIDTVFTAQGSHEIRDILGGQVFSFPKPSSLVSKLVEQLCTGTDLVLDSFAGSGTTAQAAMQLNKSDGGNRRFILVEMDSDICHNITAQRLKRVIEGYDNGKGHVEGLGGGFRYCTLGEPLFDAQGQIATEVTFDDLSRHVFFTETGEPMPERQKPDSALIGVTGGVAFYLLFNGILGDKSVDGGNVLTLKLLKSLPPHDGPRVVFGEGCTLSQAALKRAGVTFKQIPYQVKVS
ncbi:MAG: site-specific DNA-methyltransferase [Armatimonadota bacterium]|nr:site-specific DNA-methyltransferase [Armatimonadota bacterium]